MGGTSGVQARSLVSMKNNPQNRHARRALGKKRLAYPPIEAAEQLSISRSYLYELVKRGRIKLLKIGSRSVITHSELERILEELADEAA